MSWEFWVSWTLWAQNILCAYSQTGISTGTANDEIHWKHLSLFPWISGPFPVVSLRGLLWASSRQPDCSH